MWLLLVCASLALAAPARRFVKSNYSFLDVFGAMLTGNHAPSVPSPSDRYGGTKCAGCTIVLILVESLADVHGTSVESEFEKLCSRLPPAVREPCDAFVTVFGPIIIPLLEKKETADAVCLAINFCGGGAPGPVCRLLNPPDDLEREKQSIAETRAIMSTREQLTLKKKRATEKSEETPWKWLLDRLEYTFNNHLPFDDYDNDTFSTTQEFRGWSWRGKDCNDFDRNIRPGRDSAGLDPKTDWNCNGISGVNPATGKSYEDELCSGTPPFGVAYVGDSAGAHFHIPAQFMNASMIQDGTFANLVSILANEFDWPMMSTGTGYENSTWQGAPPDVPLGEYSVYHHFLERNRCSFRDYQNICVNGARVGSIASNIIPSLRRNQTFDVPMMVTYALIGNDVCSGHHTYDTFTKPAEFKASVIESLDYLDSILPRGSHVSMFGLATGSLLYDIMHARRHPLGNNFPEIVYSRVYDYLNCLEVSPCWGWLNSNATVRNYTDNYAAMLSTLYQQIINENPGRWSNFDAHYWDLDFQAVIQRWTAAGGEAWQLIEPIDGFHPAQIGMTLLAEQQFAQLQQQAPSLLPPINPNNARIQQLFGAQGGYGN